MNMLFLLIFFFIILKLNVCENSILQRPISNTVLVSNRINNVVLVVSNKCSEECYEKLLNGINFFDRTAWENDQKFKRTRVWTTFVTIGSNEKIVLTDRDDFDKKIKCQNCNFYNKSSLDDVETFVSQFFAQNQSCPATAIKEYTLIATDVCITSLNKQFYNATSECPKDYKRHGILMETNELVNDCRRQMSAKSDDNSIALNFFSPDNFTLDTMNPYIGSMKAIYYSTPASSTVNFLIMSNNKLNIPFNAVRCKFFDNSHRSCNNGILYGTFQHVNDSTSQNISEFIIPLYFNDNINTSANYFMENFEYLVNKVKTLKYDEKNCSLLEKFFLNARSSDNKYSVLLLEDPNPSCFDFDLQWQYSYKYLEIMIVYSDNIKGFYSNETMKHVTFIEKSGDYSSFCKPNNLCTAILDSTLTTTIPASEEDNNDDDSVLSDKTSKQQNETFSFWWLIAGIALLSIFIFTVLWICKLGDKYTKLNSTSMSSSEKSIFKTSVSITSTSMQENVNIECFKKQMSKENNKHWAMFLDAKNIIFNFNDILGRGSNSIVYKALLKGNSSFRLVQQCRRTSLCVNCNVAIKLPIRFEEKRAEEFIRELNFLMLLQSHPNIITLMGWTIFADTPALMTELAKTNLLNYVESFKHLEIIPIRTILQILLQISQALEFVAEQGIVHRDVACRNVLLIDDENTVAKLADFGLCCLFGDTLTHRNSMYKRFPIKWLSIEALENCEFSEKSDVWAFGILCYEVFSYGAIPYSDMSQSEMIDFLQSNQRLKRPLKTPYLIYELMLSCWKKDPKDRPKFNDITQIIRTMLEKETANYGYLNLKVAASKMMQ